MELGVGKVRKCGVISLRNNNSVEANEKALADIFNDYFSSVGRDIGQSLGTGSDTFRKYMNGNYVNSFMFSCVTVEDIASVIDSLKCKSR